MLQNANDTLWSEGWNEVEGDGKDKNKGLQGIVEWE